MKFPERLDGDDMKLFLKEHQLTGAKCLYGRNYRIVTYPGVLGVYTFSPCWGATQWKRLAEVPPLTVGNHEMQSILNAWAACDRHVLPTDLAKSGYIASLSFNVPKGPYFVFGRVGHDEWRLRE
jgi:hypothetical protein